MIKIEISHFRWNGDIKKIMIIFFNDVRIPNKRILLYRIKRLNLHCFCEWLKITGRTWKIQEIAAFLCAISTSRKNIFFEIVNMHMFWMKDTEGRKEVAICRFFFHLDHRESSLKLKKTERWKRHLQFFSLK